MEITKEKRVLKQSSSFRLQSPSLNALRLHRVFDLFDKNGDGFITVEELSQALFQLGLEADFSELESIVESFIQSGNTGLRFEDFAALHKTLDDSFFKTNVDQESSSAVAVVAMAVNAVADDSDLVAAFKVFDVDGDGFISAMELQRVLNKLGLPEGGEMARVEKMIISVDTNHDGRVDFFEFKNMMRTIVAPS